MEVKEVRPADLPVLSDLFCDYLHEFDAHMNPADYYDAAWFARLLADGSLLAFLAWQDRPVGFILVQIVPHWYRESARGGVIEEMYIAPAYRRQGYGTALALRAIEVLRERGARSISAAVVRTNITGLLFWQRLEFRIEAYDLYLYQK